MANNVLKAVSAKILTCFFVLPAIAGDLHISATNNIFENPFVAYGVNPVTQLVTGYLAAFRTSPGRTDVCRFVFTGKLKNPDKFSVKYLSEIDGHENGGSMSSALIKNVGGDLYMNVRKSQLGGDCDWILAFINEPRIKEVGGEVAISFGKLSPGGWIGVFAIKSERAPFYRSADESSVQEAYLLQGEYIYVYAEQPDWYYVKYERRKKTTIGWIKKSDTVQIRLVDNKRT
jgi:hypothetical protein